MHNVQNSLKRTIEASSLFLAYKSDIFSTDDVSYDDERIRKQSKAAYEGTQVLLNIIARILLLRQHLENNQTEDEHKLFKLLLLSENDTKGLDNSKRVRVNQLISL